MALTIAQHNALAALDAGFRVIPIARMGKVPPKGYTFKNGESYDHDDINKWGGNFAACVGTKHIVIDSDPRNQNRRDVLGRLKDDYLGLHEARHNVICTPRGGTHIWCEAKLFGDKSYSATLVDYPGIDFKRGNNSYVILPGSKTEHGDYWLEDFSDVFDFSNITTAPSELQNLLVIEEQDLGGLAHSVDRVRFEAALKLVHPDDEGNTYPPDWNTKDYMLWIAILAAAKNTFGPGIKERMRAWCKRGEKYNDKDFETTWASFNEDGKRERLRTMGTLFKLANAQEAKMKRIVYETYAVKNDGYIHLDTGTHANVSKFNHDCQWYVPPHDGERPLPSVYYRGHLEIVDEERFDPTKPQLYMNQGARCFNSFNPARLTEIPVIYDEGLYRDVVKAWFRHVEHICSREENSKYLEQYIHHWIANLIRKPGDKMKVAPMLFGLKGTGKGVFAACIESTIGPTYSGKARVKDVLDGWGNFYEGKLLVTCDEFVMGSRDKMQVSNTMKELITENRVASNLKFGGNRTIDNFCNFIFCANNVGDCPIEQKERRYIALETPPVETLPNPEDYFSNLWTIAKQHGGLLRKYYLEFFKWDDDIGQELFLRAPETEAYKKMNDELAMADDPDGDMDDVYTYWSETISRNIFVSKFAITLFKHNVRHVNISVKALSEHVEKAYEYRSLKQMRMFGSRVRPLVDKDVTDSQIAREKDAMKSNGTLNQILNPKAAVDDSDQFTDEF